MIFFLTISCFFSTTKVKPSLMTTTTQLPVALLWQYREFNRMTNPSPHIMYVKTTSLNELAADIEKNGLRNPIELSIYNGKALITDGNNRLTAYKMSGREMIEVTITYYDEASASRTFPAHTLSRFRKFDYSLLNIAA